MKPPSAVHASHKSQINRLKRIEGQIRGVTHMIEENRYCMDIVTQIKAVKSALLSVENKIIKDHINHCVHQADRSKNGKEAAVKLRELQALIDKSGR